MNDQDAKEFQEHILNAAGDAIYGIGMDGSALFINNAAVDLLGWRIEDIVGKSIHEIHHHSHADGSPYPREECPIYATIRDGEVHQVDNEVFWASDGRAIPVEYTSTPIITNGEIKGAVVVFRSIEDRLNAEKKRHEDYQEISRLKSTFESLLDAAGEGIYGLTADGQAAFINKAAVDLLGWRQEDVVGQSIHEVHHHSYPDGSHYPRDKCPIYAAITDGEVHRVDDEVFWKNDGTPVPVEYTSTPIFRDGQLDGAVVVFRDISGRKKMEEERDRAFAKIQELNQKLEEEQAYLREEVDQAVNFGEIIGASTSLKRTLAQIDAVAATPVSVLVQGESGAGKEMIARAIHARSDRSERPLVRVNCASIPENLFESEFFGHVKGAFTGAHRDRIGRMQLAHGGTLFLDEVGEIPMPLQSKLLRAIQEGQFERVGEDETRSVDVRIIAATNRDLVAEIEAGNFREDLYYRLSVFPIEIAPLRERPDDIVPLALNFISKICSDLGREPLSISQGDMGTLKAQPWPGNARELKNYVERAVILSPGSRLRVDLVSTTDKDRVEIDPEKNDDTSYLTEIEFREFEKKNILAVLEQASWRVSGPGGAADLLGVKPTTLYYRLKSLGIPRQKTQ